MGFSLISNPNLDEIIGHTKINKYQVNLKTLAIFLIIRQLRLFFFMGVKIHESSIGIWQTAAKTNGN